MSDTDPDPETDADDSEYSAADPFGGRFDDVGTDTDSDDQGDTQRSPVSSDPGPGDEQPAPTAPREDAVTDDPDPPQGTDTESDEDITDHIAYDEGWDRLKVQEVAVTFVPQRDSFNDDDVSTSTVLATENETGQRVGPTTFRLPFEAARTDKGVLMMGDSHDQVTRELLEHPDTPIWIHNWDDPFLLTVSPIDPRDERTFDGTPDAPDTTPVEGAVDENPEIMETAKSGKMFDLNDRPDTAERMRSALPRSSLPDPDPGAVGPGGGLNGDTTRRELDELEAQILSNNPGLGPNEIRDRGDEAADDTTPTGREMADAYLKSEHGWGIEVVERLMTEDQAAQSAAERAKDRPGVAWPDALALTNAAHTHLDIVLSSIHDGIDESHIDHIAQSHDLLDMAGQAAFDERRSSTDQ